MDLDLPSRLWPGCGVGAAGGAARAGPARMRFVEEFGQVLLAKPGALLVCGGRIFVHCAFIESLYNSMVVV